MQYRTGVALILGAGVLWSLQGPLITQITHTGSWGVLMWRSLGMMIVVLGYIGFRGKSAPFTHMRRQITALPFAGIIGALGLVIAYSGAIYAFQTTSIAKTVLLFSASPFFAALLGWAFLGQRLTVTTWVTILLGAFGILVMVGAPEAGGWMSGDIAALGSAFGFAIFTVALRLCKAGQMFPVIALGAGFSVITGLVGGLIFGQALVTTGYDITLALGMGMVTLSGGMILFSAGSAVVPPASATLMSLLEVLLAPLWMWLFLGQIIAGNTALGGAIVLAAIVLNAIASHAPKSALTLGNQS